MRSSLHVESLECRKLLSAASFHEIVNGAGSAIHPAAIAALASQTASIPVLTGAGFSGPATPTGSSPIAMFITVNTQSKSGRLSATVSFSGVTYNASGSVNRKGILVLHGSSTDHHKLSAKGTVNSTATSIAGTFTTALKKVHTSGTFTVGRG